MSDNPDYYATTKESTMQDYFRTVGTAGLYTKKLTVPLNTLEASPASATLTLEAGRLIRLSVKFAPGCHGLVEIRIKYGATQIYPYNTGEWVTGDDEIVSSGYDLAIATSPYALTIEGASPGSVYAHSVLVRAELVK